MSVKTILSNPGKSSGAVDLATFAPASGTQIQEALHPSALTYSASPRTHVVVVGAGVFGGWTALHLLRKGLKVTLVDAWGPGNSRSSSGDETRVIRCIYGANDTYFRMTVRAFGQWQAFEKEAQKKLIYPTGTLWLMYEPSDETIEAALPLLDANGLPYERLSIKEATTRYPQISFEGLDHAFLEKHAGYLKARESCQAVVEVFVREGGTYVQQAAMAGAIAAQQLTQVRLADGSMLRADAYVFAAGAWLGQLFPEVLGSVISSVRQEVYYFGTPAGHSSAFEALPVWVDWNLKDGIYYGIPGSTHRGFKIAFDRTHSDFFDPTDGERIIDPALLARAKEFLGQRFPLLKHAPLSESRVCQYPSTPDSNFLVDTHPEARNLWIVGGGSGHGFKMGPALGEYVADLMLGRIPNIPLFGLSEYF